VLLDPGRLRQVILNYLCNAIEFTGLHGSVAVAISREADELLIAVCDTGPGIEAIDQPHVFGEFVQLDRARHRGRGLGLAVTKLIVESQGGSVGVRSRPGAGATFYARIPVVSAPDEAGGAATPQPEGASAKLAAASP
jgi:signal transduction histidine kinase